VVRFGKEASQTRDYSVAKNATHLAARPDPSLRKGRWLRMTIKLHHYRAFDSKPNEGVNQSMSLAQQKQRKKIWLNHAVAMPQQLSHVAILPARYPDTRKAILQQ